MVQSSLNLMFSVMTSSSSIPTTARYLLAGEEGPKMDIRAAGSDAFYMSFPFGFTRSSRMTML